MEEKSKSQLNISLSDWKLKQQTLRNQRNFRQLENRLVILQMERQNKIKSIQHKLETHKKRMQIRMDRFKLKQEIQKHENSIEVQTGTNSRVFKDIRHNRANNIRAKSTQFRQTNHRLFQQVRKKREQNENLIRQKAEKQVMLKAQKRNKVRLIEIQCKQNINKFWKHRLRDLKQSRQTDMLQRLAREEKQLEWLLSLEKSEEELLREIKKAEDMQTQLVSMMEQQRSMVLTTIGVNQQQSRI